MQKQSPPMPVMCGSTTHSTATAVTAASAAEPPARSTSTAALVASGCDVAAMPSQAIVGERPGRWKSRIMGKCGGFEVPAILGAPSSQELQIQTTLEIIRLLVSL